MRFWIGLLSLTALIVVTVVLFLGEPRSSGVFPIDPSTPYFHYAGAQPPIGRILVVHGLDSSKQIMNLFCLALSGAGFEVYSIDLPGHGDSPAGFEATRSRKAVEEVVEKLGSDITVIGHSLGAGLLLDLANDHDFKAMVLLSPPPTPINRIRAERILVFTGEYDLPGIISFIPELEEGDRGKIDIRTTPWAGHSGAIFRSDTIAQIIEWLGGDASNVRLNRTLATILLLWVWSIATGVALFPGRPIAPETPNIAIIISGYVAAVLVAVLASTVGGVLHGLRLFGTDFIFSVMFLAGLGLAFLKPKVSRNPEAWIQGVLAAAYVIVIPGLMIGSKIAHLTLSDGRWWRFLAMTAAALPFFIADECFIRPIRPWWKSASVALATRLVAAGLIVTGVLTLHRSDAFIVLIIHLVVLFWMALWFAAEVVRRHTQDPFATALFTSMVQAWVLAAIFVTI